MAIVRVEKNNYTVERLHQWDLNQTLEIHGLSMAKTPEVHFTNDLMVAAVRRYATMDAAGVIRVEIPNPLLQHPRSIKVMVCIREGEVFKTYHTIYIPVKARQKPADYTITDEQDIYSFQALEDLVTTSVADMKASNAALQTALNAKYDSVAAPVELAVRTATDAAQRATDAANAVMILEEIATDALAKANEALETPAATHFSVTLAAADWVGVQAPYTQDKELEGILETDKPHYSVVYSGTDAEKIAQREAFALVDDLDTVDGMVTFTCFEEKPTVDLTIQMEVVR